MGCLISFVGGYYSEDVDLWHLKTTRMMPGELRGTRRTVAANIYSTTSAAESSKKLARNLVSTVRRWALAAAAADLRGTGHQDLFMANDYGVSELYFNNGKAISRSRRTDRCWLCTEERHDRSAWRRSQSGQLCDLCLEHF